jgi:glycosyltransferase involved in cell wall biosynthesis
VLAFVEARGVTGALGNLLDFAAAAARQIPRVQVELATYWRSARRGEPGASTADIQHAIDAAAARDIRTHVLHERYAGDPRLLHEVRTLLRHSHADIIETHHVKSHALVAASDPGIASRWVAFHHGYTTTTLKTRATNLLDRWSLTKPAVIVTPCRAFAHELQRHGIAAARISVVHSSVTAPAHSSLRDVRAPLGLRADDRIVLAVGRLSKEKAHDVLVAAFARAPLARLSNVHLVVAGDGPERTRLRDLVARLGLERVQFIGHQPDVWPYYQAADVVALPSDSEGSPIALLEAMAAGKPVVATRVGGVPEIVEHGRNGLLVPPRNPDALAAALAGVLDEPLRAAALGGRARVTVAERFTVEVRATALTALYLGLCHA